MFATLCMLTFELAMSVPKGGLGNDLMQDYMVCGRDLMQLLGFYVCGVLEEL